MCLGAVSAGLARRPADQWRTPTLAKRPEPHHKTPAEVLADLRTGHDEAMGFGPQDARRYLEKVLNSQHSLPNAVKFFAYDLLAEARYNTDDPEGTLEAVQAAKQYLAAAQEDAPRDLAAYLPQARLFERGISVLADQDDVAAAVALCDEAIALGLGKAYEGKRRSLERRL
jgi:hypothetical protein